MDKDKIERLIHTWKESYSNTAFNIDIVSEDRRRDFLNRSGDKAYHIFQLLREIEDPTMIEWLNTMIEHYTIILNEYYNNKIGQDVGMFDNLLEAAIILKDEKLLNNISEWMNETHYTVKRLHSRIKKRLIEQAIISNRKEVAIEILKDFDLTRGNVDSYTKSVFRNAKEIYEAILEKDRDSFELEMSEMKKRWKRTKEGREYEHCSWEVIYRGLFDIFMAHGTK